MPSSALRVFVAASVAAALVAGDDAPPEGMAEDLAKVADRWREGRSATGPPPPLPPAPPGGYPPPPPPRGGAADASCKVGRDGRQRLEMRLAEEENAAARAGGGAHRAPVALARDRQRAAARGCGARQSTMRVASGTRNTEKLRDDAGVAHLEARPRGASCFSAEMTRLPLSTVHVSSGRIGLKRRMCQPPSPPASVTRRNAAG